MTECQYDKLLSQINLKPKQQIQQLWSGYGSILRCVDAGNAPYIVKLINLKAQGEHPRGWGGKTSHQRKVNSYLVEQAFYRDYSHQTDNANKVPTFYRYDEIGDYQILVMEDLAALGYTVKKDQADPGSLKLAIKWLANFHAKFMGHNSSGLWSQGCYWHLDTRQDEWHAMPEGHLKQHAAELDTLLKNAKYKTLLHGDAKFDNLCFHQFKDRVAAVDFQYCGAGVGVRDLAYLAGSCLDEQQLFDSHSWLLDEYLSQLQQALSGYKKDINFAELEAEYQELYLVAWADFYRFLIGWNPKSWKVNQYMKHMSNQALRSI